MNAINPTRHEFAELLAACGDGPVPFAIKLPNDSATPVGTFANLAGESKHAFFLESVELGERLGRYSFMGTQPQRVLTCEDGMFRHFDAEGKEIAAVRTDDPLRSLQEQWEHWKARWPAGLELPPLAGGMVGYIGYDCVHCFEPIGEIKPDGIGMPQMMFMVPETVVCFDHLHAEVLLTRCLAPEHVRGQDPNQLYDRLVADAEQLAAKALAPASFPPPEVKRALEPARDAEPAGLKSNMQPDEYKRVVEKCKEHIAAGDAFQIVPSQRFSMPLTVSPLDIYRSLRKVNPSQYMFALQFEDCAAVGSSPEMQLRCTDGKLEMRPIAGTRPRGRTAAEDQALAAELLSDEKEAAEHKMLVDLARNDLGRVAKIGSVRIDRLMEAEHYSHVIHITSAVSAQLDDERFSPLDALRATFPAGTLSGAPKVRAMQLINGFEPVRRNLYGGLVGYIDLCGNIDTCIAIRMMVAKGGMGHVQAGGGVVADSDPAEELEETRRKARAVLRAIAEAPAQ